MKPQLIVDCSGSVLSALLVTADGELVPCSQEIQQVATRHVSTAILFEPRVVEDRDFIWDDAIESMSKATAQSFFQRAKRIGLRRPWDPQASPDALLLASPLAVLSSPAALADRVAGAALPRVAFALLDALLDPLFAFAREERDCEAAVIVSPRAGRRARLVLQEVFRRRGIRAVTIIPREIAAAMGLIAQTPCACLVVELSNRDLHVHRVEIEGEKQAPRFHTARSIALPDLGRTHWLTLIAEALDEKPSAAFDRSLTSLLTGSPDALPPRVTHASLDRALDERWLGAHELNDRIREPLAELAGENLPLLFAGELFSIVQIRALFGPSAVHAPKLDDLVRNAATAMRSPFSIASKRSLRIATSANQSIELLANEQFPAPGDACRVDTDFAIGGDTTGKALLIQLLRGDATLCAMPIELREHVDLRLTLKLRRAANGSRIHGTLEARMPRDVVVAHARFAEALEVSR